MSALVLGLCFATAFCAAWFGILVLEEGRGGRARTRRRLRALDRPQAADESTDESSILRSAPAPAGWLEPLRLLLERAGEPVGVAAFLAISATLAAAGAALGSALWQGEATGLAGAAAGLLPLLWLVRRRRARMRRFEQMFPDSLDLLARALRAGHALSAGLHMVGEELEDPVGPEFSRVSEEIRLGLDIGTALSDLARRADVPEMPFFVTALTIQRETGGNLAEIIDGLARVIRDRHAMNGKIRSVTAQTRWSANLLLIAPFAFGGSMALLRPGYVAPLWETPVGNTIATAALVMVTVGYVLCRRLGVVQV